jgi:hypothetical protein
MNKVFYFCFNFKEEFGGRFFEGTVGAPLYEKALEYVLNYFNGPYFSRDKIDLTTLKIRVQSEI